MFDDKNWFYISPPSPIQSGDWWLPKNTSRVRHWFLKKKSLMRFSFVLFPRTLSQMFDKNLNLKTHNSRELEAGSRWCYWVIVYVNDVLKSIPRDKKKMTSSWERKKKETNVGPVIINIQKRKPVAMLLEGDKKPMFTHTHFSLGKWKKKNISKKLCITFVSLSMARSCVF